VTYGRRVAILGDISRYIDESPALRDFVIEANRGDQVWLVSAIGSDHGNFLQIKPDPSRR
jgi:hypothetical protein